MIEEITRLFFLCVFECKLYTAYYEIKQKLGGINMDEFITIELMEDVIDDAVASYNILY